MAEQRIADYFKLIRAVFEYTTRCWLAKEGRFEVIVSDDKGKVEGAIKGGDTFRTGKDKEEDEE